MKPTYLIVNADDFGYFDSVSRGIIEAARCGTVTATGILANSINLERQIEELSTLPGLDVGVHLNLTFGRPCSKTLRIQFDQKEGLFPSKFKLIQSLLSRTIKVSTVKSEWRAQIMRCISFGLEIQFLNSHEHIHMFPPLYNAACELAIEFNIQHVRYTTAEWGENLLLDGLTRNIIISILGILTRRHQVSNVSMFGLKASGKLNLKYLERRLRTLPTGGIYELMCHPGRLDQHETIDPQLKAYHNWDSECKLLCSDEFQQLLEHHNIRLIGFRHLEKINDHIGLANINK